MEPQYLEHEREDLLEVLPNGSFVRYVLPYGWALSYALTDKQWKDVRERHKAKYPDWAKCPKCPKKCMSHSLDELWRYEDETHTKILTGMEYICAGCHWLKTPPFRIRSWQQQMAGQVRIKEKPDHIIDCLGWTQERVDKLREDDLKRYGIESKQRSAIHQEVQTGRASVASAPTEKLTAEQLEKVSKSSIVIMPWRINLTYLAHYDYSPEQIAVFEKRMDKVAADKMATII